MRRRSREIQIFNLSMLDVISGAMGAFLIVMVVLLPSYRDSSRYAPDDDPANRVRSLRQQLEDSLARRRDLEESLAEERRLRSELERRNRRGAGSEKEHWFVLSIQTAPPTAVDCTIGVPSAGDIDISIDYRPGRPWLAASSSTWQLVRPMPMPFYAFNCATVRGETVSAQAVAYWSGGGRKEARAVLTGQKSSVIEVEVLPDGRIR